MDLGTTGISGDTVELGYWRLRRITLSEKQLDEHSK